MEQWTNRTWTSFWIQNDFVGSNRKLSLHILLKGRPPQSLSKTSVRPLSRFGAFVQHDWNQNEDEYVANSNVMCACAHSVWRGFVQVTERILFGLSWDSDFSLFEANKKPLHFNMLMFQFYSLFYAHQFANSEIKFQELTENRLNLCCYQIESHSLLLF